MERQFLLQERNHTTPALFQQFGRPFRSHRDTPFRMSLLYCIIYAEVNRIISLRIMFQKYMCQLVNNCSPYGLWNVIVKSLFPRQSRGLDKTVNRSKRVENHEPPEGSTYSNIFI
jgi:hypothetical protein